MTPEELDVWQHQVARAYADEQVEAGSRPAGGALTQQMRKHLGSAC